jgi:hypothetical protein
MHRSEAAVAESWEADASASFVKRLGKSAAELGDSKGDEDCPDIWQLDNGDIAVIGRDLTAAYGSRLPEGVTLRADERLVVIPGAMLSAARADIPRTYPPSPIAPGNSVNRTPS